MRLIKVIAILNFYLICVTNATNAQELFNYAEPASNMPTKSFGIRLTSNILDKKYLGQTTYQFLPELMWGINKNLMLHVEGIGNNNAPSFRFVGVGAYAKYRFYSNDAIHRHFRMAAFARGAYNTGSVHYQELETNTMNTGGELGIIVTQLLHKQAVSASLSYEQITNNGKGNIIHIGNATRALNYTLSTGRLILPRNYTSYKQTNLNLMLELLGQYQATVGLYYIDIAPSVQFIVNSQTRLDIGYRWQARANMSRMATNSVMIRLEHLLFNVF
jgi:hypothetical protein